MTQDNEPTGKSANRKLTYVLAALFAITLLGLNIAITFYYAEMNAKDKQIKQLNNELNSIQGQLANITLPSAAPNLISVGMQCEDNRTDPTAPFLHVTGYVINVGTGTANNCTIHVYAIQNGNSTAIDTSKAINSLTAGAYEKIDIHFSYSGLPLTAYSINIGWEN